MRDEPSLLLRSRVDTDELAEELVAELDEDRLIGFIVRLCELSDGPSVRRRLSRALRTRRASRRKAVRT